MSVSLKSARELETMREAGRIVGNALAEMAQRAEPGMTTGDLDRIAERSIRSQGAEPAFPHINNFPGTACVSVNEEIVHGIPGRRRLREGDIVKVDVGAIYRGYHGDAAITVPIGTVSPEARQLITVTEEALAMGIRAAQPGAFLNDIGAAVEDYAERFGLSPVREYVGHGIGRKLHEAPTVHHFRQAARGPRLQEGMTFTIEPMINVGSHETRLLGDGWTVVTADGSLSAQFEHTIAITADGPEVLTLPDHAETSSIPFFVAKEVQ
ncbi:MAG TPA: type I methionyl aminopeptidase [Chloroflexota bacterium]|nr:type I methionyl aminopeptidase [Chloroflexota bacterium]